MVKVSGIPEFLIIRDGIYFLLTQTVTCFSQGDLKIRERGGCLGHTGENIGYSAISFYSAMFLASKNTLIELDFLSLGNWEGSRKNTCRLVVHFLIKCYLSKLPSGKLARFEELLLHPSHHGCFGIMM